jgi:SSS family solute:Na+ symporter
MTLGWIDWIVIALYGAVLAGIGFVLVRKTDSTEGYFLAGRSLRWQFIGGSLFAANISAEHFVGLAGAGYADGMAVAGFEWMAVYCLVPLVVLFLPFYIKNAIYTVPEFLEQRFSPSVRLFFSGFMVVLSVLAKISISFWASAVVFHDLLGWNSIAVIWVVGLITALYTMKGGLRVVVYTDALQSGMLIVAALCLLGFGLFHVGGIAALLHKAPVGAFDMVKPATDPNYPWPGMFFGVFIIGSFYWSMDQVLVQRAFAAKSLNEGRLGAIFCGFLKLLTPFLLVLPGVIARVLHPNLAKADDAFPTLLRTLMPVGLLGLTIAGIVAALMGHISATYNSISTLVTRDFYLRFRPAATQLQQVRVGRITVFVVFILGALWAPLIRNFGNIWIYLQSVQAYMMMPFAGIFFLGVLWRRTTTAGVLVCIIFSCVLCPTLFINNLLTKSGSDFLPFMHNPWLLPWLHSASVGFLASMVVLVVVSAFTLPESDVKLATTTVGRFSLLLTTGVEAGLRDYRYWLGALLVIVTTLWYLMR